MRWLVLFVLVGCTWRDSTSGSSNHGPLPDAPDPAVHCGNFVFDGDPCDVTTDAVCEWSEGIDAGAPLPIEHCVCRFDGRWKCQTQTYHTCAVPHHTGETCTAADSPCEYPIEADAGPSTDVVCTCSDGAWQCAQP